MAQILAFVHNFIGNGFARVITDLKSGVLVEFQWQNTHLDLQMSFMFPDLQKYAPDTAKA